MGYLQVLINPEHAKVKASTDIQIKKFLTIVVFPCVDLSVLFEQLWKQCLKEESELNWRAYSRILKCKSRPPQSSLRDESQIIVQSNQELQLATEEGSVQSNPTSVRSNTNGSVRISPEPSNVQLLNNQNECTPPRLESMEAMSGLPTAHSFALYPGENELIQFEEGFYNTDLPILEISNLVSDDSSSSSSSSSSHVSLRTGNIPRSIDQTISRVNTNPNSTTLETGDYSTFQSHSSAAPVIQDSAISVLRTL
ncbi:hypothetical protein ACTFIW_003335 [Dictyostelium discoideum]